MFLKNLLELSAHVKKFRIFLNSAHKKNESGAHFFYNVRFFYTFNLKKMFSCFVIEIFDSEARFGSSVKIYPENPSSWTILAMFQPILELIHMCLLGVLRISHRI